MAVSAIQNNNSKNNHKTSYLKAAGLGALGGYALKYIIPVAPQERDESYSLALDEIKIEKQAAKAKEIASIRNITDNVPAADEFIKICDNKDVKPSKYRMFRSTKNKNVIDYLTQVNNAGKKVNIIERIALDAKIKRFRSTKDFALIGATFALSMAFISNVLVKMSHNNDIHELA